MKKIISLLLAVALVLSMSVAAFAAGESQNAAVDMSDSSIWSHPATAGTAFWVKYPATTNTKIIVTAYNGSSFTAEDAQGNPLTVYDQVQWGMTQYCVDLQAAAGETVYAKITPSSDDYYGWTVATEGSAEWPIALTSGTQYTATANTDVGMYYTYTPAEAGTLTVAIDTANATNGWGYEIGQMVDGYMTSLDYPDGYAILKNDSRTDNDDLTSEYYPNGSASTYTVDVAANTTYCVAVYACNADDWSATGTIPFTATFTAGGSSNVGYGDVVASGTDVSIAASNWNGETVTYTNETGAEATVTMNITAANPGWCFAYEQGYTMDTVWGDAGVSNVQQYTLAAGDSITFHIWAYDPATEMYADGVVSYEVCVAAAGGSGDQGGGAGGGAADPIGSENNPQMLTGTSFQMVTVPGGATYWVALDDYDNMWNNGVYCYDINVLSATDKAAGYDVLYAGGSMSETSDADGYTNITAYCNMMGIYQLGLYNKSQEEATFFINFYDHVDIEEYIVSTTTLQLGANTVAAEANAQTTIYEFAPEEAGIYTITVDDPDALLSKWIGSSMFISGWEEDAVNGVLTVTCTSAGQPVMVGLANADSAVITIAKTGEYVPPAQTTYLDYTPTVTVDTSFEMPQGTVTNVDITQAQTVVLGNDGYYHLGTYAGPILYVNLNSDGFTLATLLDAGAPITMRGEKFTGEDGELYCYDYMNMMAYGDYYTYARIGDYYPLNADLMAFFQDYGTAQGWYMEGLSGFSAINAGGVNEDSAWLVAAGYIEGNNGNATAPEGGNQGGNQGGNEGGNQGGNTGNQGGNTGNQGGNTGAGTGTGTGTGAANPNGGDFGVIGAVIALAVSAMGGAAVIAKKKEN